MYTSLNDQNVNVVAMVTNPHYMLTKCHHLTSLTIVFCLFDNGVNISAPSRSKSSTFLDDPTKLRIRCPVTAKG